MAAPFSESAKANHEVSGGDPLYPDAQITFSPISYVSDFGLIGVDSLGFKRELMDDYFSELFFQEVGLMGPALLRPKSRGSITLRSTDPFDQPNIDLNLFSDPDDLEFFVRGCRFCLEILDTKAMRDVGAKFFDKPLPGCRHQPMGSDDYWRCFARHLTSTIYHPVGTCKMAPDNDPMGVVDNKLRVRGVTRLRVADASIMPLVTSGNTVAPTIMIGERAADFIKEDYL
ncbi:UNVERIFIED_CONTAM: hypothetical protein RMT77_007177 [Armadillidium vulgare]